MTLEWSSSKDRRLFLIYKLPDSLQDALSNALRQHYEELYEPEAEGTASLQDALDEILELFHGHEQTLSHLRCVWMALILATVVEPTVKYYQPNCSITDEIINQIAFWLLEALGEIFNSQMHFTKVTIEKEAKAILDVFRIFTEKKEIASFQVLAEALNVYSSAIKTLDYNQSFDALSDILDDCLEGYAIFPGSYGRRELFNWWLLEVVPASWYLCPPSSIYSADKSANGKKIICYQMVKLEKISAAMWSIILKVFQSQGRSNLSSFPDTFDCYSNKKNTKIAEINFDINKTKITSNKLFN